MASKDGSFYDFLDNIVPTFFFSTDVNFVGNLEWKMCLYIVYYVLTCQMIYFVYVDGKNVSITALYAREVEQTQGMCMWKS